MAAELWWTNADSSKPAPQLGGRIAGTVVRFDAASGLGEVTSIDGDSWIFHATAIADGSRTIEKDSILSFIVAAGAPGRWEAHDLVPQ